MVIAKLTGGLGNQIFQYACARALSLRIKADLLLDVSEYEKNKHHQGYQLDKIFTGTFNVATQADIINLKISKYSLLFGKYLKHLPFGMCNRKYIEEPSFSYWEGVNDLQNDVYLSGYWQSEKYFINYSEQIRSDLVFKNALTGINKNLEAAICKSGQVAVSLHIRRGDYVKNLKSFSYHGLCSLDYYKRAINYIKSREQKIHIFLFSDDIDWVKNNINLDVPCTYVENLGDASYIDMHLMSMCKHNILANSSFSWWAAWLNINEDKIVIAPERWFAANVDSKDLIPSNWIKI